MNSTECLVPTSAVSAPLQTTKRLMMRLRQPHPNREWLNKAIGRGRYGTVLDCTGGLGQDALIMARIAHQITVCERDANVFEALNARLDIIRQQADLAPLVDKLQLVPQCAIGWLASTTQRFDVIYCDPMFTDDKPRKAKPNQAMQWLQSTILADGDQQNLINLAFDKAQHRLVVKCPAHATPLLPNPTFSQQGSGFRLDVYQKVPIPS